MTDQPRPPSSYADFSDAEPPGWLKTAIQFFAIPLLIVLVAVGIYVGVNLMVGAGPQNAADFVNLLQSDTINRRWQAAYELAARLGGSEIPAEFREPRLVQALGAALGRAREEEDPRLAKTILLILRRLGDPASLDAVRAAVDDPDPEIRSFAILALPRLDDRDSIPRLRELTGHEDHGTRQAALVALAELDQAEGLPYRLSSATRDLALRALGDRHEDVRFQAAILLAKAKQPEALPVLRKMLDREHLETFELDKSQTGISQYEIHSNLILAAIDAARRLDARNDPEVVAALRKLSGPDGDEQVRNEARKTLTEWGVQN